MRRLRRAPLLLALSRVRLFPSDEEDGGEYERMGKCEDKVDPVQLKKYV
jgi:hypothetical protein